MYGGATVRVRSHTITASPNNTHTPRLCAVYALPCPSLKVFIMNAVAVEHQLLMYVWHVWPAAVGKTHVSPVVLRWLDSYCW